MLPILKHICEFFFGFYVVSFCLTEYFKLSFLIKKFRPFSKHYFGCVIFRISSVNDWVQVIDAALSKCIRSNPGGQPLGVDSLLNVGCRKVCIFRLLFFVQFEICLNHIIICNKKIYACSILKSLFLIYLYQYSAIYCIINSRLLSIRQVRHLYS